MKSKLLKANLHIRFNKKCIQLNVIPKYSTYTSTICQESPEKLNT